MASQSSQNVYTFDKTTLTVGGRQCLVSSVIIQLMENAIPTVTLTIDPIHTPSQSNKTATAPTLTDITKWHDYYSNLAVKRTPCNFSTVITSVGGDTQNIDLKGWLLTGAGVSQASASGSVSLELELQHPVCLCQDSVLALPYVPPSKVMTPASTGSYGNLVDAIGNIALTLSKAPPNAALKDSAVGACTSNVLALTPLEAVKFLQQQLGTAAQDFMASVEWSGGAVGWPLMKCLGAYLNQVKFTVVEYFTTGAANNIWELLIRVVGPAFMVTLVPSLTGKMKMRPTEPWLKPNMFLYDSDISSLTFPGTDPSPIIGVTAADMQMSNTRTYYADRLREFKEIGVTFAPMIIKNAPGSYRGSIVQVNVPSWLTSAQTRSGSAEGNKTSAPQLSTTGNLTSPSNILKSYNAPSQNSGSSSNAPASTWTSAAFIYAQAAFYRMFRQGVQVSVRCRLMTMSGASELLPGDSCSVISNGSNVAFDFYVTSVIHSFSCADGTASTEVSGTYARPSAGFPGIVPTGTRNPLYE